MINRNCEGAEQLRLIGNRSVRAIEIKGEVYVVFGILAHVDAGKTTLSEALLYRTGQIRSLGRVDHQDAYLDNDAQERERGITIFSKQARIEDGDWKVTLLDTPGHVDFSAEMERTLSVLDYAILVISGTDGVQGHTRTLWRLLRHYRIPTVIYVNKMDLSGADPAVIEAELKKELSDGCIDFQSLVGGKARTSADRIYEELAVTKEALLNEYMETGEIAVESLRQAISERLVFPCIYGSALKLEGVSELIAVLKRYTVSPAYGAEFAARVYKIGRDPRGVRLTYLKVTGGELAVKDRLEYPPAGKGQTEGTDAEADRTRAELLREKIDQIRIYSGERFASVEKLCAGEVCAVTGLSQTYPGMGLGAEQCCSAPVLEPVLTYRIFLPKEINPMEMMGRLKQLEEEDPQLHIVWNEQLHEIHAQMMGQVQIEVLTRLIKDRFGVVVSFGPGNIVYKETIARPVEGVGHFEPLRHYAEVHLLLEPGEPGSGIQVASICSEDTLALNWQRLIATHIEERSHKGVLTGSVLTDVKCTILTGRAHMKHTEGGDFRQATYRAIRHGLKNTESVLLEPYYRFVLEIPVGDVGRAMTDLEQRFAKFQTPELVDAAISRIEGTAPVSTMQDYMAEVHAYTRGLGHLQLELSGYDVCHNSEEVIVARGYDSESDLRNPTGSVFCAHGSGFVVPWDEVCNYMHLPYVYQGEESGEGLLSGGAKDGFSYDFDGRAYGADTVPGAAKGSVSWAKTVSSMSEVELDRELADVYAREFCMSRGDMEDEQRRKWSKKKKEPEEIRPGHVKLDKKGNPMFPAKKKRQEYLIVDGYNIIFAWQELKELAKTNMDGARDALKDILLNYQGCKNCYVLVVFDAYKVKGNPGKREWFDGRSRSLVRREKAQGEPPAGRTDAIPQGIEVVYTRQDETADAFIERKVHEIGQKYKVTVATSDGLEQLTVLSMGALRMPAAALRQEIDRMNRLAYESYEVT